MKVVWKLSKKVKNIFLEFSKDLNKTFGKGLKRYLRKQLENYPRLMAMVKKPIEKDHIKIIGEPQKKIIL